MSEYWFKPKTHGYGAHPTGWKGWAVIAVFVILLQAITVPFIMMPALSGEQPMVSGVLFTLVAIAVATWGFLRVCRAKTEGEWKWRWGK